MGMGEAFKTCMRKYADFNGRARRSEFWWFYLALFLIQLPFQILFLVGYVAFFVDLASKADANGNVDASDLNFGALLGPGALILLVGLAFALPTYAAEARRLHDMGQSGLWVLLNFAGVGIVPLIMCIMDTQPGPNQWGPDPKQDERLAWGYPPAPPTVAPPYA